MFHHQITAYREFKNPEMLKSSGVFLFIKKDIKYYILLIFMILLFSKKKSLSIIFLQQMVYFLKWAKNLIANTYIYAQTKNRTL
jgi:hypothetical protein